MNKQEKREQLQKEKDTRLTRLHATKGLPIHTIIAYGLVCRSDWEIIAGAEYPVKKEWRKRRDGSIYFVGKCGSNVYPK